MPGECSARSVREREDGLEERVKAVEETLERLDRFEEECASRSIKYLEVDLEKRVKAG